MGLAASQAKLLSITSRLSDNELRSQSISAAKMALASKSSEASRKYINSLNANEYTYKTYDADGQKVYVPLTGSRLSKYGPLKNQYALVNNSGQILLSETDAANYESSADLETFLSKYGITLEPTGETQAVANPAYTEAFEQWQQDYNEWILVKPDPAAYWEYGVTTPDNNLYEKFAAAAASCYGTAISGDPAEGPDCYLHVLAHLLELELHEEEHSWTSEEGTTYTWHHAATEPPYPKTFLTTPAQHSSGGSFPGLHDGYYPYTVTINTDNINGCAININGSSPDMQPVSDAICYGYNGRTLYAVEDLEDTLGPSSSTADRLLSNYVLDSSAPGGKRLKTLKQQCIDLFYAVQHYSDSDLNIDYQNVLVDKLKKFHQSLRLAFTEDIFNEEQYNQDIEAWYELEPILTEPPTLEEPLYEYSDKDMAQWYINLWYRANGPSDTNTSTTSFSKRLYDILEDGLMNSQQWLKYALETCAVSVERVVFAEETMPDNGIKNAEWESVIYTNVLEISEVTNDKAIAIAEAEYEQTQREIENKDKQYDSMLRLLDTEHSALQAEYESVQKVIPKNLERTLKIYS